MDCDEVRLHAEVAQHLADAEKARAVARVRGLARVLRRESDLRAGRKPNEKNSILKGGDCALRAEANQYEADVNFIHQQLIELMKSKPWNEESRFGSTPDQSERSPGTGRVVVEMIKGTRSAAERWFQSDHSSRDIRPSQSSSLSIISLAAVKFWSICLSIVTAIVVVRHKPLGSPDGQSHNLTNMHDSYSLALWGQVALHILRKR